MSAVAGIEVCEFCRLCNWYGKLPPVAKVQLKFRVLVSQLHCTAGQASSGTRK